jgi:phospholipase/carboxylesterase
VTRPAELARAAAVLVLLHGRGHEPASMHELADRLGPPDLACVAPAAPGRSWYPGRFFERRAVNEPALSHALGVVAATLDDLTAAGVDPGRIVLGGFSQGACIACDALARRPRRLGALAVLCGGLIGADGADGDELAPPPAGALAALPVLLTGTEKDAWVPLQRVRRSAELLAAGGAAVDLRVHPPAEHRVHDDELDALRELVAGVAARGALRPQ